MRRAALLIVAALLATPALAQQRGEGFRDADERPRGDFVFQRLDERLLMLDTRTGCVWGRSKSDYAPYFIWRHEFPSGEEETCKSRIRGAVSKANGQ